MDVKDVAFLGYAKPNDTTEWFLPRLPFNHTTANWERLEKLRMNDLGVNNCYQRHFNMVRRHSLNEQLEEGLPKIYDRLALDGKTREYTMRVAHGNYRENSRGLGGPPLYRTPLALLKNNSIAPFATIGKRTCGYFFSLNTDNRKPNIGIPPVNLIKWRTHAKSW